MSLLWKVIVASACRSTHHYLAMDALRLLRGPNTDLWQGLFLKHYEAYLSGAKAPDDQFKDFKNHVLHVSDNFWGGAVSASQLWYERTVLAMRKQYWPDVAYSAGVLSHYFTDPHMPFHTGQTEEEGKVHRAAEWSITCSYAELQSIVEKDLGGFPEVTVPAGSDWLASMLKRGAQLANAHYFTLIEHYDLKKGVKDPKSGLDQECKDILAALIGQAASGFARVLDRAAADAAVKPPLVELSLETFLATVKIPARTLTKKMQDENDRAIVQKIYDEVRRTGKVVENLPADDKMVRRLYAEQVLKVSVAQLDAAPTRPAGQKHGVGAKARDHRDAEVSAGPVVSKGKAKPAKIENPLLKATTAMKGFSPYSSSGASYVRPSFSSAPRTRSYSSDSAPPKDTVSVPLSISDPSLAPEPIDRRREAAAAATVPSEGAGPVATPAARRTWFKKPKMPKLPKMPAMPTMSSIKNKLVGGRVGKMIEKAKAIPSKLRLRPLAKTKLDAGPTADEEIKDTSKNARRISLDVADESSAVDTPRSTNPLASDTPRRRTDLEVTQPAARRDEKPAAKSPLLSSNDDHDADEVTELKFYLDKDQPLEDAPTIGPKLAKRFQNFGVHTVADFLAMPADKVASQLNIKSIDGETIKQWQAQAILACRIPQIRGHDAQILVGCGVTAPEELARLDERELLEMVTPFAASSEGQRILRNSAPPDIHEVRDWIAWAKKSRSLKAA